MFNRKEQAPTTGVPDEQLAIRLRETAQCCADMGAELTKRGWSVSVNIYPNTSDKGPVADVRIYRQTTL